MACLIFILVIRLPAELLSARLIGNFDSLCFDASRAWMAQHSRRHSSNLVPQPFSKRQQSWMECFATCLLWTGRRINYSTPVCLLGFQPRLSVDNRRCKDCWQFFQLPVELVFVWNSCAVCQVCFGNVTLYDIDCKSLHPRRSTSTFVNDCLFVCLTILRLNCEFDVAPFDHHSYLAIIR